MQIIIDIPDDIYEQAINGTEYDTLSLGIKLRQSVQEGVVIPKGHGRLIDVDAITKDFNTFQDSFVVNFEPISGFKGIVCKAPIIIKADKEEQG